MPSRDTSRLRENRSTPKVEPDRSSQSKASAKDEPRKKTFMDSWVEPPVATQPSYQDHHGAPYGVVEHMQTLGEAPSAKVKARVRSEAPRKSVLGRSSAAVGMEGQETPEGTPAPQATPATPVNGSTEAPPPPPVVIDDEKDEDYAPAPAAKKKEPATRAKRASVATSRRTSTPASSTPATSAPTKRKYDPPKLKCVVEAAKDRAMEVGKPDLAAAVHEIWVESLKSKRLTDLLEAILTQTATAKQTEEFQNYVKRAKQRLKDAKTKTRKRPAGASANGTQALPLRSPSQFTPTPSTELEPPALPSTEPPEKSKPKLSIKVKSPSKDPKSLPRSAAGAKMSESPPKQRERAGSESSELTDLTSDGEDGVDGGEPDELANSPAVAAKVNGVQGKDHAAERGSLAAPDRKLKRSSAEAGIEEDEREREIATKKLKLNQTIMREEPVEESDMRRSLREPPASQQRSTRAKNGSLVPPPISLPANGRAGSARASRAVSADLDSPLSELSAPSSRLSTPRVLKAPPKPPGKRAKTKNSPEKKQSTGYTGLSGAGGAGRESPIGDDDNEEASENNDFCSACGGSGFLLCCDGCDRSFHFSCLDPPLNDEASELNEPWYCYICVAKRPVAAEQIDKPQRGLFAPLLNSLRKRNPSNFFLPQDIRDHFESVSAGSDGNFVEAVHGKTRQRAGYDELPDYYKTKDSKGHTVLCYHCGKSSLGQPARPIIQCDYCNENWHLDCLDPPLANPPARNVDGKKLHDWMCPLHADLEMRKVDTRLLVPRRRIHMRRPRNPKVVETSLRRGFQNNGVIDVLDDDSNDSESEFYDEETPEEGGVVHRMPASGIKLDFIDKIKNTRVQKIRDEHVHKRARTAANAPSALQQANFARRSFAEQQLALNLAQFAAANNDLDLGQDQVENLVGALIAEAPSEVVDEYMAAEDAEKIKTSASAIPPSPPGSDQTDQLSAEQRKKLQMLQELIRRKLESSRT